ncbi:pro-thyrotropin-releasing hormone isoform 1-T2 [Synchiropus picturatus]
MKPTGLLILASVIVWNLTTSSGQGVPTVDETDPRTIDDFILQRAESLLLRSLLRKMQDEDDTDGGLLSQPEWVSKRQHPGKRFSAVLEKRQHPGRRDEDEDEEDEPYLDIERRQHPGKREDEMHSFVEFQKRQHPGKRSTVENPMTLLGEITKRQHPGKRYLLLQSKRQHPGKRHPEDEDGDVGWDGEEDLALMEKRQHPGKRFWDNSNPALGTSSPCDLLDPTSCSKTSLLLDFLDNLNKSHTEEKRQHPGKRFAED